MNSLKKKNCHSGGESPKPFILEKVIHSLKWVCGFVYGNG